MANYNKVLQYAREMRKNPTKAEKIFWRNVRNRRFEGEKFYRQYIIKHGGYMTKESYFIADFYCHKSKLIIELDGPIHEQQQEYDEVREEILNQLGYKILRFKNEEILQNWQEVKTKIKEVLDPHNIN